MAFGQLAALMGTSKDRAYTAGLLSDVGRLALLSCYPDEYAGMLEVARDNHFDVHRYGILAYLRQFWAVVSRFPERGLRGSGNIFVLGARVFKGTRPWPSGVVRWDWVRYLWPSGAGGGHDMSPSGAAVITFRERYSTTDRA